MTNVNKNKNIKSRHLDGYNTARDKNQERSRSRPKSINTPKLFHQKRASMFTKGVKQTEIMLSGVELGPLEEE
jgi:hypothetical protein